MITLSEAIRAELAKTLPGHTQGRTFAELVAQQLVRAAAQGSVMAAKEIPDRTEGRPRQAVDIDMSVRDWRELARQHGISEADVLIEARRIIGEYEHVSVTQLALQNRRLKVAPGLRHADTLAQELLNFRVKISAETAHDSYGAWREGQHDDLVLATALALWVGTYRADGWGTTYLSWR